MITSPSFLHLSGRFFVIALLAPMALSAQTRPAAPATAEARVAPVVNNNYKITGSDKLAITVHDEPDLTVEAQVDQDGRISLPLIGSVRVSGMSSQDAAELIKKTYIEQEILKRPSVTVSIAAFSQKSVNVIGEVTKPGPVLFTDGQETIDLISAIAAAGDFKGIAQTKKVKIIRNSREYTVNVRDIIDGKQKSIKLIPGDVVSVPPRIF